MSSINQIGDISLIVTPSTATLRILPCSGILFEPDQAAQSEWYRDRLSDFGGSAQKTTTAKGATIGYRRNRGQLMMSKSDSQSITPYGISSVTESERERIVHLCGWLIVRLTTYYEIA